MIKRQENYKKTNPKPKDFLTAKNTKKIRKEKRKFQLFILNLVTNQSQI